MQTHLYDSGTKHLILYCDDDWKMLGTENSYGHDIETSWLLCESAEAVGDEALIAKIRRQCEAFRSALVQYREQLDRQSSETPYGVPCSPSIWGAGWDIQSFGYRHYFLAKEYPEIFAPDQVFDALHFILGRHPGSNQASFAGGVGSQSATVGYGFNRSDWTYIPGGTVSGTALIRPDFPELLVFPYLWQQVEYVMGGGSSHYMFLVLATKDLLER